MTHEAGKLVVGDAKEHGVGILWRSSSHATFSQLTALLFLVPATLRLSYAHQNEDEDPGCGTNQWPYLKACYVPAWKLLVHGHRKSCDDHVRLMMMGSDGAVALDQAETKLVAPVPTVADGENFITGMALDYSSQVTRRACICICVC
jgi:hypothetical protein